MTEESAPQSVPVPIGPSLLQRAVDWLERRFFPGSMDPRLLHFCTFVTIIILAILLRRIITGIVFAQFKRLAAKPNSKLDKRLFPALEGPAATLVMLLGIIAAISVFPLSPEVALTVAHGSRGALTAVIFWGLFCAGGALIDHLQDLGRSKQLAIAVFVPLIKKTLAAVFGIFAILVIAESFGWEVKEFLAGLGIGGLAIALAAQDTLANLFGSFVVMMDHPFHLGDVVKIGPSEGAVEDIGLRSTRLRTGARSQIIIPNKVVASEAITNFTRMPQRRVDQTIGVTYDTTPDQIEQLVAGIRALIAAEPGVHPATINVTFANFGESSLDVQILYFADNPDWIGHMALRERINLGIMRLIAKQGLSFAFPTRSVVLEGPVIKKLADSGSPGP